MLYLLTVKPKFMRPRHVAAAAIDRYLLWAWPNLSSKPANRLCCCRLKRHTDGQTLDCFMMLTAYYARVVDRIILYGNLLSELVHTMDANLAAQPIVWNITRSIHQSTHQHTVIHCRKLKQIFPTLWFCYWQCWLDISKSIRLVKIEWWGVGVAICLERGADCLHRVQLMPLLSRNLIISCLI